MSNTTGKEKAVMDDCECSVSCYASANANAVPRTVQASNSKKEEKLKKAFFHGAHFLNLPRRERY
jgi:hypothetical protein